MPRINGRFWIERDCDGWSVMDGKYALCLSWDTRAEAEGVATFVRAYVRKWGDINFDSFPLHINDPLLPFEAEVVDGRF